MHSINKIIALSLLLTVTAFAQDTIELGQTTGGNKNTYIDFRSDDTYTDFGLRLWRSNGGPNADSLLVHRGTGHFNINLPDNGNMLVSNSAATHFMVRGSDGNVGIGTGATSAKLTVIGTISAKEVKVTTTGFPDYVFAEDYKLRTLDEVEAHIKEHKHLPGIPSAAEVERDGLALSDISKKQMEKIEELTLYMIELKKQNEELKKSNTHLLKRVEALEQK